VCPTHGCPLEQACPHVSAGVFPAGPVRASWFLPSLRCLAGARCFPICARGGSVSDPPGSAMMGALLARTPGNESVSHDNFLAALRELVDQATEGNLEAFARLVGLTKTTLWELASGRFAPPLSVLLRLCRQFQISLVDLLLIQEGSSAGHLFHLQGNPKHQRPVMSFHWSRCVAVSGLPNRRGCTEDCRPPQKDSQRCLRSPCQGDQSHVSESWGRAGEPRLFSGRTCLTAQGKALWVSGGLTLLGLCQQSMSPCWSWRIVAQYLCGLRTRRIMRTYHAVSP